MTIRDRDRKILWSRAGNCCSICRTLLVRESEVGPGLTVIGEECHIVSPAEQGPRASALMDDVDAYDNLILLCPNHHRLVDTLVDDYPTGRLHETKRSHEEWVRTTLERSAGVAAVTIVRGAPTFLRYLGSGREVLEVAASAEESSLDYEDLTSEDEVELVAGFLQRLHDDGEMWDEYEPADRIRYTFELDREIRDLEERGWRIFGARARGQVRGGPSVAATPWDTAYLRLIRAGSPSIIPLGQAGDGGRPRGPPHSRGTLGAGAAVTTRPPHTGWVRTV